jgi:hypothetical protein
MVAAGLIAYDRFHRKRQFQMQVACIGNLVCIELTKLAYATEHGLTNGAVIPEDVIWREHGHVGRCFAGGNYSVNPVGVAPSCSYTGFVHWHGHILRHSLTGRSTE